MTYTIDQACGLLGVGRNQGYAAALNGDIPTIRVGKRILVPKEAFDRLLREGTPRPSRSPAEPTPLDVESGAVVSAAKAVQGAATSAYPPVPPPRPPRKSRGTGATPQKPGRKTRSVGRRPDRLRKIAADAENTVPTDRGTSTRTGNVAIGPPEPRGGTREIAAAPK